MLSRHVQAIAPSQVDYYSAPSEKLSRQQLARTQEVRQTARGVVYRGLIFELHGAEMVCCSSCLVSAGF